MCGHIAREMMVETRGVARDQLRTLVERIERLEQEAVLDTYLHALGMAGAPGDG